MNTTVTAPSLQVRRLIKASRARVFDAWTQPDLIMKWLGGASCRITSATNDLRVGGAYALHVSSPEHGDTVVKGAYREITPPSRLVFTWTGTCADAGQKDETLVTVELADKNGATEVCITHEGFPSAESCDNHRNGWGTSLERMEKLLGGQA